MLPFPTPPTHSALRRTEGWFACCNSACRHHFFRNLSPDSPCQCGRLMPPNQERVVRGGTVITDYACSFCARTWSRKFGTQKQCNRCESVGCPVSPDAARGYGYGTCARCNLSQVSPNSMAAKGDTFACAACAPGSDATVTVEVVCGRQRHLEIQGSLLPVDLKLIARAIYSPPQLASCNTASVVEAWGL
jgi:hypothetical protein